MQCTYLRALPQFDKVILLVRHAERAKIADLRQGPLAMLTETGKADARLYGRSIPLWDSDLLVIHSSIYRCQQTAEQIVKGAAETGHKATLGSSVNWLTIGRPDAEMDFVAEMVQSKGYPFFLRKWYDGQLPSDRIAPSSKVARAELADILQYLEYTQFSITLGVTHDAKISILFEHFLGLRFEDVGMPALLDSIAVSVHNGKKMLWYQGHSVEVSTKESSVELRNV